MSNNSPVGFFDSGLGGATVLKAAIQKMPNENFVFYGDNANAPYGGKTKDEIRTFALNCAKFLSQKGAKAIVIACNTATSAAIIDIRSQYNLPVISMEPSIKPALENLKHGKILMLATQATCKLDRYLALKKRLDVQNAIVDVPCNGLVEAIETQDTKQSRKILEGLLGGFDKNEISAIVLGCTHYSLVKDLIEKIMCEDLKHFKKDPIKIYDGIEGTINQLKAVLKSQDILNTSQEKGKIQVYTSAKNVFETTSKIYNVLEIERLS